MKGCVVKRLHTGQKIIKHLHSGQKRLSNIAQWSKIRAKVKTLVAHLFALYDTFK
jgi:hypothetical protein